MARTQAKAPESPDAKEGRPDDRGNPGAGAARRGVRGFLLRILMIVALALAIGTVLNHLAGSMHANAAGHPAGFLRGVAQGALMPLALPNLLVGSDVVIYTPHNTGRTYKLGYTIGVNGCGAVFFGFLFWRLNRLRKRLAAR